MIKRRHLILFIILLAISAALYWLRQYSNESKRSEAQPSHQEKPADEYKINGRRVINPPAGKAKDFIEKMKISNQVSEDWQENLQKTLKVQGGEALKDIKVEKMESLIWNYHGTVLNVESVRVSLTNQKGEKTSFKAMIDSQSGKILQTWDQPVIDPINPRESSGIKLDPRYLQD